MTLQEEIKEVLDDPHEIDHGTAAILLAQAVEAIEELEDEIEKLEDAVSSIGTVNVKYAGEIKELKARLWFKRNL